HEKGKEKVTFQTKYAILNFSIAPHVIRIQNHNLINGVASINLDTKSKRKARSSKRLKLPALDDTILVSDKKGLVWRTSILEKHLMKKVSKQQNLKNYTSHTCLVFIATVKQSWLKNNLWHINKIWLKW
ncbi:hypothetical protein ACJX0J_027706, partial [Zea mays]